MGQKYYLGLDMGTSSVGWAVTDENYNLLRAKGKDLWGIREFEEALTAADRRSYRVSRRRHQREVARIGMLQGYFHDAISEVDPYFYQRLENSKYHLADKDDVVRAKNGIFNDETYTDEDYYNEYPTIFHLRMDLINNPAPHDVRFVYLALLNMFKHRGHFLNATLGDSASERGMLAAYLELAEILSENAELSLPKDVDIHKMEELLGSREFNRTKKSEQLANLLGIEKKDKKAYAIAKAICGLNCDVKTIFDDIETEEEKKLDFCFGNGDYEEKILELAEILSDEQITIISLMKEIYNIGTLACIMKGHKYLSEARIADYNKHKDDLRLLKKVYKNHKSDADYDRMFRSDEKGTYSAYVNSFNSGKVNRRSYKERKAESLYATIKKDLKNIEGDADVEYIMTEIGKETFLPKQLTAANGVIPNQVHYFEMQKILENAEKYLPFLSEIDEGGRTVSDRILQLFKFQIPYYVGPTSVRSEENDGNGWVVRKEEGPVLPWNLEEKIDLNSTRERFIQRLVRNCTYINGEKVLPKGSLLYEKYCVLNEINNIKINDEPISVGLKQSIYNDLFKKGKKVTRKGLARYLNSLGAIDNDTQITGIDITINNALPSYGKFKAVFGDKLDEDKYMKMAEDIVFWGTVYSDSKKVFKEQIEQKYGNQLSTDQIKRLSGLKFKDWGRLSKEFLELPGVDNQTGEIIPLIRAMWETNYNSMELINSDLYTFKTVLKEKSNTGIKSLSELTYEDLKDMYFSAPVRRMIWQTLLIIKELEHVLEGPPERIFIEMTRSDEEKGEKGRKDSRAKQLIELYKTVADTSRDWESEIKKADEDGRLRSKKLYLYYTQMGKCMYTGESIEISDLFNDDLYDIDHIYPQHFVKDDSIINNKVLVRKEYNNKVKGDVYPVPAEIRNNSKVQALWTSLHEKRLISDEKYHRLTSNKGLTPEQKAGFIARQLVETGQGTKGVADILKAALPDTTVVYAKASNVSDFRRDYKMLKSRLVNDFHHAQDAYLNIVVGNVYYTKFTQSPYNFIKTEYLKDPVKNNYHLNRMFDNNVKRGDYIAWVAPKEGEPGTIKTVKDVMSKNTPLMTRLSFVGHGKIADATLYAARNANKDAYIPLKAKDMKLSNVEKYGGYTNTKTAYLFIVEHKLKGQEVRTIESIPVYLTKEYRINDSEALTEYCTNTLELIEPRIILPGLRLQSLIRRNGYYLHIAGRTGARITFRNAVNLILDRENYEYARKLEKGNRNIIKTEQNIKLYDVLVQKHINTIFSKRPNSCGKKLLDGREAFIKLESEKQADILLQILQLTKIGDAYGDLSAIGGAPKSGTIKIGNNISKSDEFKYIAQSVTGLYEKEIDLLAL